MFHFWNTGSLKIIHWFTFSCLLLSGLWINHTTPSGLQNFCWKIYWQSYYSSIVHSELSFQHPERSLCQSPPSTPSKCVPAVTKLLLPVPKLHITEISGKETHLWPALASSQINAALLQYEAQSHEIFTAPPPKKD